MGDAALKAPIKVTTTIIPWGLIVIALLILQFILLGIRNAVRRRNARRQPGSPSEGGTVEALTPPDARKRQSGELPEEINTVCGSSAPRLSACVGVCERQKLPGSARLTYSKQGASVSKNSGAATTATTNRKARH